MKGKIKVRNLEATNTAPRGAHGIDAWDRAAASELRSEGIQDGDVMNATFDNEDKAAAWVKSPRTGYDCILYKRFFTNLKTI